MTVAQRWRLLAGLSMTVLERWTCLGGTIADTDREELTPLSAGDQTEEARNAAIVHMMHALIQCIANVSRRCLAVVVRAN